MRWNKEALSPPGSARLEAGTLAYPQGATQSSFPLCQARLRSLLTVHQDTGPGCSKAQGRQRPPWMSDPRTLGCVVVKSNMSARQTIVQLLKECSYQVSCCRVPFEHGQRLMGG